MSDFQGVAAEGETPVNPYSLLEAVNRSSDTAHTAWLIFLGIMAYLMVAVAGVTHQDFLVEKPVSLPILQVDIQLTQFFQFAPVLLVLLHLGVVAQLVLVARKTLEFDKAIRLLETSPRRTHPLRLELHNFFFVQGIAGSQRSAIMGGFLHGMSWLTLVILPVVLLLYIQVVFLPYHSVPITWTHRIALLFDVAILVLIGVFLSRAETSFFQAFWRTTASHPVGVFITAAVLTIVTVFSLLVATIPGEFMDRAAQKLIGIESKEDTNNRQRRYRSGFLLPFGILSHDNDGALFGLFRRNLVVTDTDLVVDKDVTPDEPTLNLRNRDLRYARLDRSDLHQADLTGANLDYASLEGTDLRDSWMHCADLNELLLTEDRLKAKCTSARHANFARANLNGAKLTGIDARHTSFEAAEMRDVLLTYAILIDTGFSSTKLHGADFTGGVQAQGTNFLIADLQGADFTGAQMQYADFSSANLQAATFNYAHLQSAKLQGANLNAASLLRSKLYGADMSDASITGTDLRWAAVWKAKAPNDDSAGLADLSSLDLDPMTADERQALTETIDRIQSERIKKQMNDALAPLTKGSDDGNWSNSSDGFRWRDLQQDSFNNRDVTEAYRRRLTTYLTRMMCQPRWREGSVAMGVSRRAQSPLFRGYSSMVYAELQNKNCPASSVMSDKLLFFFPNINSLSKPPVPSPSSSPTFSPTSTP